MWQWLGRITIMLVACSEWWVVRTKCAMKSHLKWKVKHFSSVSECRASTGLSFPDCGAVWCVALYCRVTDWADTRWRCRCCRWARWWFQIQQKAADLSRAAVRRADDLFLYPRLISPETHTSFLTQDHSAFIPHLYNPTLYFNWVHCITQVKQTRRCRLY